MDIGALLKTVIYLIASSLLYPTLLILVVMVVWIILYAGGFFAEWLQRARRTPCNPFELPSLIRKRKIDGVFSLRVRRYIKELNRAISTGKNQTLAIENLLQESNLAAWKSIDRLRIFVRLAPGLGLIGTLIPMGTGLAALGQGDITRLTTDLVIAFTTTVVGLAIGMAAFFLFTLQRRWLEEDIKNMELVTEILTEPPPDNVTP